MTLEERGVAEVAGPEVAPVDVAKPHPEGQPPAADPPWGPVRRRDLARHARSLDTRANGQYRVMADGDRYLAIYLNDHLAGSSAGLELAKRIRGANEGTELGASMERLVVEIAEDRDTLLELIETVGASPDRIKVAAGWAAEKLGRLKLNGHLLDASPLSPLVELEGLSIGVEGKRVLWVALLETQPDRFGADRLRELIARAERQRAEIEEHRRRAAGQALSPRR